MAATGMRPRQIADALGISQPAVQPTDACSEALTDVHPEVLLEAAAPILTHIAEGRGFTRLTVFGSVARHSARQDSDIDLLVAPPPEHVDRTTCSTVRGPVRASARPPEVDLFTYGGLKPGLDDDIPRQAVLL